MNKIAHIINPFDAPKNTDLYFAQPITMQSMLAAKKKAEAVVDVELFATKFSEDSISVPSNFTVTNNLQRSVLDVHHFAKQIRLPFVIDILERLYYSSNAEYLIYTNVDIGLYPNFYIRVNEIINQGFDSFIINRRRLSDKYKSIGDLEKIYLEKGKKHPGFDCFVFHRSIFPKLKLEGICIGVPFIEISFSQNLFSLSKQFSLIDNEILTFHLGMEIYKKRAPKEYFKYNKIQFWKVIKLLKPELHTFPYYHYIWPFRIIRWGLHPCIPIKLVFQLEKKRIGSFIKKINISLPFSNFHK